MARRVRHPLVSFAMFMIVVGVGLVAWEHRDELKGSPEHVVLERDVREGIENEIFEALGDDACFTSFRGQINWRPNEGRYRLDIELEDGDACETRARTICELVAMIIHERTDREATVCAFDGAGRELARRVL